MNLGKGVALKNTCRPVPRFFIMRSVLGPVIINGSFRQVRGSNLDSFRSVSVLPDGGLTGHTGENCSVFRGIRFLLFQKVSAFE